MPVPVPPALKERYRGTTAGRDWLASLPQRMEQAMDRFGAAPDIGGGTEAWHGHGALVLPVRSPAGPAVLKFPYPHPEAASEPAALTLWNGTGAVRLLEQDAAGGCLLLERLDERRSLLEADMATALGEWGRLIRLLALPASDEPEWAGVPSIAERTEQLSDEIPSDWESLGEPFERWLMEAALEVSQTRGAVGRRSSNDVLVHADLHFGNILLRSSGPAADGGPGPTGGYVAIDPQAMVGEAEYAVAPMLWNRLRDLDPAAPEADLRRRLSVLCTAGGLDPEAAAEWSVLRLVHSALEYFRDGEDGHARRSLWVAAALLGRRHPGLPPVRQLQLP